ncbi:MAG: sigma-54-dependent Fis family transcriptional regulator, partial [Planctomycetes bacterium]|nr:sigma-54-dependent Fis family transcriptional regulator [Planctomycetota bacterium]
AELEILIQKAYERRQLSKENEQLKSLLQRNEPQWEFVGESPAVKEVFGLIERAGPTDKAILIQGESGTGKELAARALHRISPRFEKPMVVMNCATISESLLESELFGHEKGAFTGAFTAKQGLFELADGGTLLIDEIGEMPTSMQAKLLRVLEDGSMRRVGSLKERRVNVRLLCSTNRNIRDEMKAGRFREDLYYRINVMTIDLPPLRERSGDVPILVSYFLGPDWEIEETALKVMKRYRWPGNVRELINVIERGKILADGKTLTLQDLPDEIVQSVPSVAKNEINVGNVLAEVERAKIVEVLNQAGGNKTHAAGILGVTRRSLYRLLEKHKIFTDEPRDA